MAMTINLDEGASHSLFDLRFGRSIGVARISCFLLAGHHDAVAEPIVVDIVESPHRVDSAMGLINQIKDVLLM